jgi:hypothetical protein
MAKQTINVGSGEYSGDGESIRIAFTKVNSNFTEIYTQAPLATTATYAQSFNTSTLVRAAVSATTSSFATTSGYALSFNTGTIVGTAVSAITVVNGTWTLALSTAGSILLNGTVFSGGAVSTTTSTLVNGTSTITLNSTGTLTFPDATVQTTAYTGLTSNGNKASSTATGTAGQTSYDSDYFYICIATDTWRRVALGSTY